MNPIKLLPLLIVVFSASVTAQNRVYSFSQIQSRVNVKEWGKVQRVPSSLVYFTPEEIDLNIDKKYHLTIVSKTDLPDNGTIFLCNDEKKNQVTVMLIDDSKMYVYSKSKRYLINFDPMQSSNVLADSD